MEGLYGVLAHRKKLNCDPTQPWGDVFIKDYYFRLVKMSVGTESLLAYYPCVSELLESCSDKMMLFQSLVWRDGQWAYWLATAMYLDGACNVTVTTGIPELKGVDFSIVLSTYAGTVPAASQAECTVDLAAATPIEDLECKAMESYLAEKLL